MGGLLALLLTNLPTIISVASDVSTLVEGVKAAGSVYGAVKATYPDVAKLIDDVGAALPPVAGASSENHVESIARALFVDHAWTADQQAAWFARADSIHDA